jgi:monoamine oxidase
VRLDTPVTAIRWDGPDVLIATTAGTVRAGAAIVTVPVGVLKAGRIRFTPELPGRTEGALDGLGMGAYTKIALRLDRARVGQLEGTDYFEILDGVGATSFEFWPFGRDLALAILGGDHARRLCEAGERAAIDFATERLASMVGGHIRGAVIGGRLAGWWTDPHACGSYSVVRPGHLEARTILREPLGNRIWFAGEATAGGGAMTVGGATLDGRRAAEEVARHLAG